MPNKRLSALSTYSFVSYPTSGEGIMFGKLIWTPMASDIFTRLGWITACLIALAFQPVPPVGATESNANDKIVYVEDGEFSKALHIPTYEWLPKNEPPSGIVLAIHGLTLHGKRYEVICKAFAARGFYACAFDMRAFGRCYFDHKFCVGKDCKNKLDLNKSYREVVQLAADIKQKYPTLPMLVVAESLGTSLAIRLASEHPEMVDGLILSAPTVKVHPLMFIHPKIIGAATFGLFEHPRWQVNTDAFVKYLVSNDPDVVEEMLEDPLCRKGLTIMELVKTGNFVRGTLAYARKMKTNEAILIIQGSEDRCMVPDAITELSRSVPSSDQTLRWLHEHGHLLLETPYLRTATVDALSDWVLQHNDNHRAITKALHSELIQLGAKSNSDDW